MSQSSQPFQLKFVEQFGIPSDWPTSLISRLRTYVQDLRDTYPQIGSLSEGNSDTGYAINLSTENKPMLEALITCFIKIRNLFHRFENTNLLLLDANVWQLEIQRRTDDLPGLKQSCKSIRIAVEEDVGQLRGILERMGGRGASEPWPSQADLSLPTIEDQDMEEDGLPGYSPPLPGFRWTMREHPLPPDPWPTEQNESQSFPIQTSTYLAQGSWIPYGSYPVSFQPSPLAPWVTMYHPPNCLPSHPTVPPTSILAPSPPSRSNYWHNAQLPPEPWPMAAIGSFQQYQLHPHHPIT